jgi:hypothetical protein
MFTMKSREVKNHSSWRGSVRYHLKPRESVDYMSDQSLYPLMDVFGVKPMIFEAAQQEMSHTAHFRTDLRNNSPVVLPT